LVGCPLCCCSPLAGLKGGVDQPRVLKIVFGLAVGLCLRYTTYYHLVPRVLLPLFPYCPSSGFVGAEQEGMGVNTPATVSFGATPSRLDARLSGRFYKVITKMPPSFFARQDWCLNLSPCLRSSPGILGTCNYKQTT